PRPCSPPAHPPSRSPCPRPRDAGDSRARGRRPVDPAAGGGETSPRRRQSTSVAVNLRNKSRLVARKTCIRARVVLYASVAPGARHGQPATTTEVHVSLGNAPRVLVVEHDLGVAEDL